MSIAVIVLSIFSLLHTGINVWTLFYIKLCTSMDTFSFKQHIDNIFSGYLVLSSHYYQPHSVLFWFTQNVYDPSLELNFFDSITVRVKDETKQLDTSATISHNSVDEWTFDCCFLTWFLLNFYLKCSFI